LFVESDGMGMIMGEDRESTGEKGEKRR